MGLFSRKQSQSSITFAPGAVNLDAQTRSSNGAVSLDEAHRALQLGPGDTLMADGIWRVRSNDCAKLQGPDYWIGTLRPKGQGVAVYFGNKAVGTVEPRGIESAKKMLKAYGGKQARCVISNTAPGSWNIYVNML
jgi:hypothetical protein